MLMAWNVKVPGAITQWKTNTPMHVQFTIQKQSKVRPSTLEGWAPSV